MVSSCIKSFLLLQSVRAACMENATSCKEPSRSEAMHLVQHHAHKLGGELQHSAKKMDGTWQPSVQEAEAVHLKSPTPNLPASQLLDALMRPSINQSINGVHATAKLILTKSLEHCGVPRDLLRCGSPGGMCVHDESIWTDVLFHENLGLGEGWMHGKWSTNDLRTTFRLLLNGTCLNAPSSATSNLLQGLAKFPVELRNAVLNRQSVFVSEDNIKAHYDSAGDDLFEAMLGPRMAYTCGYWRKGATTVDDAQAAKFALIGRKLDLKPGMRVLDIGCGFGTLAAFLAEQYQVEVVGVTLSENQIAWAQKHVLPQSRGRVRIVKEDYRDHCNDIAAPYDRVVSVGMFEHVGVRNYETFFSCARKALVSDGLFLLHTIAGNEYATSTNGWIDKYVFPGGMLPSLSSIAKPLEDTFMLEDMHNFGTDYNKTLVAWIENLERFFHSASNSRYTPMDQKIWMYYMKSCSVAFEVRQLQLWQLILSPRGSLRQQVPRES